MAVADDPLLNWASLNEALRAADERVCAELIRRELRGRRRWHYVKRIHHRFNKMRSRRERRELEERTR